MTIYTVCQYDFVGTMLNVIFVSRKFSPLFSELSIPRLDVPDTAYQFLMTLRLLMLGSEQRDMLDLLEDHSQLFTQV
jgi:hypothetical protein